MKELYAHALHVNETLYASKLNIDEEEVTSAKNDIFSPHGLSVRRIPSNMLGLLHGKTMKIESDLNGQRYGDSVIMYAHLLWLGCKGDYLDTIQGLVLRDPTSKEPRLHSLSSIKVDPLEDGYMVTSVVTDASQGVLSDQVFTEQVPAIVPLELRKTKILLNPNVINPYVFVATVIDAARNGIDVKVQMMGSMFLGLSWAKNRTLPRFVLNSFLVACHYVPGSKRTMGAEFYQNALGSNYLVSMTIGQRILAGCNLVFSDPENPQIVESHKGVLTIHGDVARVKIPLENLNVFEDLFGSPKMTDVVRRRLSNKRKGFKLDLGGGINDMAVVIRNAEDALVFDRQVANVGMVKAYEEFVKSDFYDPTNMQVQILEYFPYNPKKPGQTHVRVVISRTGEILKEDITMTCVVTEDTLLFRMPAFNGKQQVRESAMLNHFLTVGMDKVVDLQKVEVDVNGLDDLSLEAYARIYELLNAKKFYDAEAYYGGEEAFRAWLKRDAKKYKDAKKLTFTKDGDIVIGTNVQAIR